MIDHIDNDAKPPTHEAFWPSDIFTQGLGWVILTRLKSNGARAQAGVFLIDVFCLGAKLAFYEDCEAAHYRSRILGNYQAKFPMVATAPACARKLIEQSVQYANALGIQPHPDYRKAVRVFGGVSAEACTQQFTFGKDGKPFYIRGPNETEARARCIVNQLQKVCGTGNFNFAMPLGSAEEINRNWFG